MRLRRKGENCVGENACGYGSCVESGCIFSSRAEYLSQFQACFRGTPKTGLWDEIVVKEPVLPKTTTTTTTTTTKTTTIFIPTFSFEENVRIADFSNFCDMHFRNDKNFAEKQSETADLGKRKWKKSNGILAGKIFGEIETEFDENAKMQVDFVDWTDEVLLWQRTVAVCSIWRKISRDITKRQKKSWRYQIDRISKKYFEIGFVAKISTFLSLENQTRNWKMEYSSWSSKQKNIFRRRSFNFFWKIWRCGNCCSSSNFWSVSFYRRLWIWLADLQNSFSKR